MNDTPKNREEAVLYNNKNNNETIDRANRIFENHRVQEDLGMSEDEQTKIKTEESRNVERVRGDISEEVLTDYSLKLDALIEESNSIFSNLEKLDDEKSKRKRKFFYKLRSILGLRDEKYKKLDEQALEYSLLQEDIENEMKVLSVKTECMKLIIKIDEFENRLSILQSSDVVNNPYKREKKSLLDRDSYYDILSGVAKLDEVAKTKKINIENLKNRINELKIRFSEAEAFIGDTRNEILTLESEIKDSLVLPERGVTEEETKDALININRQTELFPEGVWDLSVISKLSTEELIEHINEYGSGRFFLHSFPEISIENGYLSTSIGAGEDYKKVRGDAGCWINFIPESMENSSKGFYGTFGSDVGGGVYYPAEVIMENYPLINTPYSKKDSGDLWSSSEWRSYANPDNPKSSSHRIPLNLGVCFFSIEDKDVIEKHIENIPKDQRPNKIIWYEGYNEMSSLQKFIKCVPVSNDLPHLSEPFKVIGKLGDKTIFGTDKAKSSY